MNVRQFGGDFVDAQGIDAEPLVRGQSLAGELEQNALEYGRCHQFPGSSLSCLARDFKRSVDSQVSLD